MNSHLLNRAIGTSTPESLQNAQRARFVHALQPAKVCFEGQQIPSEDGTEGVTEDGQMRPVAAHRGGTNSIAIDKFDDRYLLSGGADATVSLWDLQSVTGNTSTRESEKLRPLGSVPKSKRAHNFGVTHVSFYPFDSLAFLTTSYDHTLKVWSSETLQPSASFSLDAVVYSHAQSPIASHLLVACAAQQPTVRLVDLKSASSTHSLAGHVGAVLSVGWSPTDEHVLCSSGTDGTVRFWDVRRSTSSLGQLDMDDSVGLGGTVPMTTQIRTRNHGRAHRGAANGVVWTADGRYVVSVGHDEKMRVWDTMTGANTLANFGPLLKNSHLSTLLPLPVSRMAVGGRQDLLFYPSENEILMYECLEGRLLKRLKVHPATHLSSSLNSNSSIATGVGKTRDRVSALAFRTSELAMYSSHTDGKIHAWLPRTSEDALFAEDECELEREAEAIRNRKRKVLEDIHQSIKRRDFSTS